MCDECQNLQKKISHYRGFLKQQFDALSTERIQKAIKELEQQKEAMH
jgi:cell division protein ZapA (FtsZ GTPase activity inhibitor)